LLGANQFGGQQAGHGDGSAAEWAALNRLARRSGLEQLAARDCQALLAFAYEKLIWICLLAARLQP
jgi:hypothetical protein